LSAVITSSAPWQRGDGTGLPSPMLKHSLHTATYLGVLLRCKQWSATFATMCNGGQVSGRRTEKRTVHTNQEATRTEKTRSQRTRRHQLWRGGWGGVDTTIVCYEHVRTPNHFDFRPLHNPFRKRRICEGIAKTERHKIGQQSQISPSISR
jgi:hypothetical protein